MESGVNMRFIFMSEGETVPGHTHEHRYRELVDEVLLAEEVGFRRVRNVRSSTSRSARRQPPHLRSSIRT